MKNFYPLLSALLILVISVFTGSSLNAQKVKKLKKEDIQNVCQGLDLNSRPRITVSGFKIQDRSARAELGQELSAMLTNAMMGTGCFDVLETISELGDEMQEIHFNNTGATNGSGPQAGNMLGSQLVVTGSITEFDQATRQILGVGSDIAHIGLIVKVVDIQTRQIIYSGSFEGKSTKPHLKVLGTDLMVFGSAAMEDAAEKIIIEATNDLCQNKQTFERYKGQSGINESDYSRENCPIIESVNPSVMVIIPEIHISRKVPDPAGETEIIKRLIQTGYRVIDPSVYQAIRNTSRLNNAMHDASVASKIGQEFGADIVIIGEAFSEADGMKNGMFSCRARVEARAVLTKNAQIIGADGKHAGGLDNTELVAGKTALRNAGTLMANYFIDALCSANLGETSFSGGSLSNSSQIVIENTNFKDLLAIEGFVKDFDGVDGVSKAMSGKTAKLSVSHTCSLDEIATAIAEGKTQVNLEITGFSDSQITVILK